MKWCGLLLFLQIVSALLWPRATCEADTIAFASGLTYPEVQVEQIEDGQVYYVINGDRHNKPATEIVAMTLDDQPDFNTGEGAYRTNNFSTAADAFAKAMANTDKSWLKAWIAPRLLTAANNAGRFDLAVMAWIEFVGEDPEAAAQQRPALLHSSDQLDTAAAELTSAATSARGQGQRLILGLLLDVQTARNNAPAANAIAQQLAQLTPAATADLATISVTEQQTRLAVARVALYDKQYGRVMSLIDGSAAELTDPAVQAEALFLKAQALEDKATADNQADEWKDAALAYLRVYVHFRDGAAGEHSATALTKAAEIEADHLGDPLAALTLYRKAASEYNDTPAGRQADAEVKRITGE